MNTFVTLDSKCVGAAAPLMEAPPMKTRFYRPLLALLAALAALWANAALAQVPGVPGIQSAAGIQQAVDQFMRQQIAGMPGKTTYTIGALDPRLALPGCAALDVFVPAGSRLWGQTNLGVRCNSPGQWTIYVGVDVRVSGSYLTASHALAPGQVIGAADIATQSGDLTLLPQGVFASAETAIGKITATSIAAGQPLRHDLLKAPLAIQQGQSVKLLSGGNGFRVSAEGKALNNAQDGQLAQVRTGSGQTVSGIARTGGTVEVAF
jgi:flagella basal body P-ring formation protein FlgA